MIRPLPSLLAITPITLLLAQNLQASVLIDDFSVNSSVVINAGGSPVPVSDAQTIQILGQNATRTFQAGATTGQFQGQIRDNAFGFAMIPGGSGLASLFYSGFSADLSATPFLRLDFNEVAFSPGTLAIEIDSTSNPLTVGLVDQPLNVGGPYTLFFDVRAMSGFQDGFLNGVDTLVLAFQGTQGPAFTMQLNSISFTTESERLAAIPEPAAVGGVAGVLLAGVGLFRRVRNRNR